MKIHRVKIHARTHTNTHLMKKKNNIQRKIVGMKGKEAQHRKKERKKYIYKMSNAHVAVKWKTHFLKFLLLLSTLDSTFFSPKNIKIILAQCFIHSIS